MDARTSPQHDSRYAATNAAGRPYGVMFHHFHGPGFVAGEGSLSGDDLRRLLDQLGRENILPAEAWMERVRLGELRPTDVCLTFDDNLRCQFEIALPVLRSLGCTGFWFIPTAVLQGHLLRADLYRRFRLAHFETPQVFCQAFESAARALRGDGTVDRAIERFQARDEPAAGGPAQPARRGVSEQRVRFLRDELLAPEEYLRLMDGMIRQQGVRLKDLACNLWMDDDCLRQLRAEGHVIGLHSHTHPPRLAALSPVEQRREYRANHAYLTSLLGEPPHAVAHPCNSYRPITLRILAELGLRVGFRSDMSPEHFSELEFPRRSATDHLSAIAPG
jgi:peptidoglycan/xylan/chitin deacetylase (PgdA/CDA1 family)